MSTKSCWMTMLSRYLLFFMYTQLNNIYLYDRYYIVLAMITRRMLIFRLNQRRAVPIKF